LSGRGERLSVHILLVDDDALLRRSLTFNLEQAGYRVSSAATAEDALAIAARDRPDLVLLDIGLPGMDGLDALRHLRSQMGVPVIFVTARRRELDEVLGLELGADDYVTKPFDLDVLLARVKAVLRRSERAETRSSKGRGSLTVGDLAKTIHSDFYSRFKYARIWGPSANFPAERVGLDRELADGDIIELHA